MGSPVVHFEIHVKDTDAAQAFYKDVFDWSIDSSNPMNYGLVSPGGEGGIDGGITPAEGPPMTVFYIQVDDPQAKLDEVVAKGGQVVQPLTEIPGMVTFALFADLDGNTIGLVKSD